MDEELARWIRELPDEELVRLYAADDPEDGGEVFIAIYVRYRDQVRQELEGAGLSALEAEDRVGSVFVRALDAVRSAPISMGLRNHLLDAARAAARDPQWRPI